MKRKEFLKRSAFAGLSFTFLGNSPSGNMVCTPTPEETEGPFPTHKPANLVGHNIAADRMGVPLHIKIAIFNINDYCMGLKDAIVDIWHCDSKGEYSEYGGPHEQGHHGGNDRHDTMKMPPGGPPPSDSFRRTNPTQMPPPPNGRGSMQAADHVKEHYLRGRQTTNAIGEVSFISIYPGWYVSRAPHIHLHIYNALGKSLMVTQVALPEEISKIVYSQGVYANHGQPETTNASDNVFFDSIANELAIVSGNSRDGFLLTHAIYVKA
jgi:protocatechuate 3,4-dioxygenase beta subunit